MHQRAYGEPKYPISRENKTIASAMAFSGIGKTLAKIHHNNNPLLETQKSSCKSASRSQRVQGRLSACLLSKTLCTPVTGSTNSRDRASSCSGRE